MKPLFSRLIPFDFAIETVSFSRGRGDSFFTYESTVDGNYRETVVTCGNVLLRVSVPIRS